MPNSFELLNGLLGEDNGAGALLDDKTIDWISYGELKARIAQEAARLAGSKSLIFLSAHNDIETVVSLYGTLAANHAVALINPDLVPELHEALVAAYRPRWLIENGQIFDRGAEHSALEIHDELAVLLSTSGSTGSPKFVRLTRNNIKANAVAIAQALHMTAQDCGGGHLPLHYSYGLSVLTSHLAVGARVRLTKSGFMDRSHWEAVRDAGVTQLPGVPFHIQMMMKMGLKRLNIPSLRSLTQAGGHLETTIRQHAHAAMEERGGQFFVMYGQTEAAPRMTTLAHIDFLDAPHSVGTALPGCAISVIGADADGQGEVEFKGSNVMMGYAENAQDLGLGDVMEGRLLTGDVGKLDQAGRLTLVGRTKRFGKIFGLRVNLDEVEAFANTILETAVIQKDDKIIAHVVSAKSTDGEDLLGALRTRFALPPSCFEIRCVPAIVRSERGKVDYRLLEV